MRFEVSFRGSDAVDVDLSDSKAVWICRQTTTFRKDTLHPTKDSLSTVFGHAQNFHYKRVKLANIFKNKNLEVLYFTL